MLPWASLVDQNRFGFAKFETVEQGMACIVALSQAGYQCSFAKVVPEFGNLTSVGVF